MPAPVLLLTDYESAQTYFAGLVQAHKLTNQFIFGFEDELDNEVKAATKGVTVWLEPWEKTDIIDKDSRNFLANQGYSLLFMKVSPSKKFADQHTTYIELERIAKDFMSKLLKDKNAYLIRTTINGYKYGRAENKMISATDYVLCRLDINHLNTEDTTYYTENWNS